MRTLAFDGRMGASGDMILGALLAAGADRDALAPVEDRLDVTYLIESAHKNGIAATSVDVVLTGDAETDDAAHDRHDNEDTGDENHDNQPNNDHEHSHDDHSHDHPHDDHTHDHPHDHGEHEHAEGAGPSRSYPAVVAIVESMDLPSAVEDDALAIFEHLAAAEAAVHGQDVVNTHFHEVGADDAIADVVGACLLLADLDVEQVVTTPLAVGGGEMAMSHGRYPVPAPAVVELAERADWRVQGGPVEAELLTPTGAAILTHLADGIEQLPEIEIETAGYGAGGYDFPEHPNVLRALVGETGGEDESRGDDAHASLRKDEIRVLETTLDDATPEILGGLHESLAAAGARDVSVIPVTMKKSRPGHLVRVIVKPEDVRRVARRLAVETGTLGVRETGARHRWIADRERVTTELEIEGVEYEVRVKIASDSAGEIYDVSAEYDDAAAVAAETELSVREVMRRAETNVHS